jgi:hypothetical protein
VAAMREHVSDLDENERPGEKHTPERLGEYLDFWRGPFGTLTANQIRALLAWRETPYAERERLKASLAIIQQREAQARSLAPAHAPARSPGNRHNSRLGRLRGIFRSRADS